MKLKIILIALMCVLGANKFLPAESSINSTLSETSAKASRKKEIKEKETESDTDILDSEETEKLPDITDSFKLDSDAPITVNGDKIEYSKDTNVVVVEGNVVVTKGESVMTCDRATVNTLTNDAHAEGNVILKDLKGIIKARSCDYNFKTQTGLAFDANVAYKPYYGKGTIVKKVSE